jgi:hypothetical protein
MPQIAASTKAAPINPAAMVLNAPSPNPGTV